MSPERPNHDELQTLLSAMFDGQMTSADQTRLAELLHDNPEAQQIYVDVCWTHALLRRELGNYLEISTSDGIEGSEDRGQWPVVGGPCEAAGGLPPSSIPPIVLDLSPTFRSPFFAINSPVGGFVFSYLAATLLVGIGLLIGSAWKIYDTRQMAVENDPTSQLAAAPLDVEATRVGRITGAFHCRWADPKNEAAEHDGVHLGRQYALASGFLEITYDTGAKVILEGPASYTVESARSGFLAIGKLTARVESPESRVQSQTKKQEHSGLSTLNSGLFAVRTPTAVVVDLGTEFGVEVDSSGTTRSHVFQGKVELRLANGVHEGDVEAGSDNRAVILRANEFACVQRGRNKTVAITRKPGQPDRFVRRMPSSLIPHPSSFDRPSSLVYRLTDLGSFGGKFNKAYGINALGQIVGASRTSSGVLRAFLYDNGFLHNLGAFGDARSIATDINVGGQITGFSDLANNGTHAFLYSRATGMKDLGTLGGTSSYAFRVNASGHVVGSSATRDGKVHAFLHDGGKTLIDLGVFGGSSSGAYDINDRGQVVGCSTTDDGATHAFLYSDGVMRDIGTLDGLDGDSGAVAINNVGQVAGKWRRCRGGVQRVFVFSADSGVKRIASPDNLDTHVIAINNAGQVVGFVGAGNTGRACISVNGAMVDLNTLLDHTPGWILDCAMDINDRGQIVGRGTFHRKPRAFLLTPIHPHRNLREERSPSP